MQNTLVVPVPKEHYSQMVIKTKGSTSFSTQGSVKGESHGWIDVSDKFRNCEFLNVNKGVYIRVDGSGSDEGNIGMAGSLNINCLAYLK